MLPGLGLVLHRRTRRLRLALAIAVGLLFIVDILQARRAQTSHQRTPSLLTSNADQNIFIASLHWNSEAILREAWPLALLRLVDTLRARSSNNNNTNVFVSIYESGSWDRTKSVLLGLDKELASRGVPRRVVLDKTTHADEMASEDLNGWVTDPSGQRHRRRIPYLAGLRNTVLEPLREQKDTGAGVVYDKIVFIEDIAFSVADVLTLLDTRGGDYAAACALDASVAPMLYDTFALRDSDGHAPLSIHWPFFRASASRNAVRRRAPVPVRSCWNGLVAMDAAPFYDGLHFRGLSDSLAASHLEASECCLIHADNNNDSRTSTDKGVWMNTDVRVGYNRKAYDGMHPPSGLWLSTWDVAYGLWSNRLQRWTSTTWFKERIVDARIAKWAADDPTHAETDRHCTINEMQVLVANGWAHI
ncbi:hypothetical protein HMPREF1624_03805 [Sporothrix schenckii ATCC 58251]|uniref:Polysaccharide export protein n=1 Tax=Sporothrix schenckii (strain ATCC 58251 / de Perez 2211183) TaxID=1391915 RepID=U7PXS9_SPOS1|nr:hypothetical protein HMPREF1624_03805 [Sporothrix schenckii ATCC 58251]